MNGILLKMKFLSGDVENLLEEKVLISSNDFLSFVLKCVVVSVLLGLDFENLVVRIDKVFV